jgi:SPP1 gp7 family putative phage head morphogenesis protein
MPMPVTKAADAAPDESARVSARATLERAIRAALNGQADRVLAAIRETGTAEGVRQALAALWPGEPAALARDVLPAYDRLIAAAYGAAAEALPTPADYGLVNADALALARARAQWWANSAAATSDKQVAQIIADWIATGGTLPDLVARVEQVTGYWAGDRVDVSTITEVTDVFARASRQAWEASGLVARYRVETSNDERVCPICGPRQGQSYPIADTANLPPYHGRCRCWVVPEVD